jgi:copper(I)-binding protein
MQNPLTPGPRTANRVLHLGIAIISAHSAGGEAVKISDAWVHAAAQVGGDVALIDDDQERILRRGRAAARNHVMLLQTRHTLAAGEGLNCSIVFQKAGTIDTEVKVHGLP